MADPVATLAVPSEALAALCRRHGVRRLDLFGSAVDGRFDPVRSDIDLLVEFGAVEGRAYAEAWFGLREGLERLFGRPVDLLTPSALANPFLRARIEAQRRQLFPPP